MTRISLATPVALPDSLEQRRAAFQVLNLRPAHAHPGRKFNSPPQLAILIIGAGGGLGIIAVDEREGAPLPADQLAARAKRLYKGQRAQLIAFNVVLEA